MFKNYRIYFSILAIFFLFIFTFYSINLRIDASSDTLVSQKDEDFKFFNHYQKIFPNQKYLILAIQSKNLIDKNLINTINKLSNDFEKIADVSNVFSINKAPILFLNNTNLIDLSNNKFETINNSNLQLQDILNEFVQNPIYVDQIINKNKNISSIIIYLKESSEIEEFKKNNDLNKLYKNKKEYLKLKSKIDKKRQKLISDIRFIIKNSDQSYNYYLGGIDMITDDVISFVKKDIIIFSISVLIIIIIILYSIFRNIKWVLICLFSSIYSVISMIGIMGFLNIEVTAVSANFSSLMFILSISMNIHIINNYINNNKDHILINTIKIMIWPCFYTVLTTIVAFASLTISDIKPIVDFGYIMILSLIVILICSFTILPLLISFVSKIHSIKNYQYKILDRLNNFSVDHSNKIIFVSFFIFIFSIYGITKLEVENSFINYFKKNTEIYQGMKIIDSELGGTTPVDIILTFKNIENKQILNTENENDSLIENDLDIDDLFTENDQKESWFNNEKINIIHEIHSYLDKRPEIGKVTSLSSLLNLAELINKKPLSIFELTVLYDEIPNNYKKDLIYPYLSTEKNMAKITARVKDSEKINRKLLIKDIKQYISTNHNEIEKFKVNGLLVLYNNMLQSLFSSQIKSIGFVILAIFIMFLILFRSLKLSVIGIIPNIIVSMSIIGMIGILKISLDIMTITIAAISIGIAVDNTIHYLYRYKENLKINKNMIESIKISHMSVGFAVLTTSITIALGFSVLALSNFIPTVIFGIFTSLAMLLAMLGVLILLPSLLKKIG